MGRRGGPDLGVNRPEGKGPGEHDEVHVLLQDQVGRRQQVIAESGEAGVGGAAEGDDEGSFV